MTLADLIRELVSAEPVQQVRVRGIMIRRAGDLFEVWALAVCPCQPATYAAIPAPEAARYILDWRARQGI